jgi:hypothetical protein
MIWPDNALACECAPPPPPCVEYSATPLIFLGSVTEAIQTDGWVRLARMRIDKAYKGISEETVMLYADGMCDGPSLRVGEQYLVYTHDDGTGHLPSRGCTRSRNVKYADEDLAFLNSLAGAEPSPQKEAFPIQHCLPLSTLNDAVQPIPLLDPWSVRIVDTTIRKKDVCLRSSYGFSPRGTPTTSQPCCAQRPVKSDSVPAFRCSRARSSARPIRPADAP